MRAVDWSSPFIWSFSLVLFVLAVAGKMPSAFLIREPCSHVSLSAWLRCRVARSDRSSLSSGAPRSVHQ
jgi:hypothetical protein